MLYMSRLVRHVLAHFFEGYLASMKGATYRKLVNCLFVGCRPATRLRVVQALTLGQSNVPPWRWASHIFEDQAQEIRLQVWDYTCKNVYKQFNLQVGVMVSRGSDYRAGDSSETRTYLL